MTTLLLTCRVEDYTYGSREFAEGLVNSAEMQKEMADDGVSALTARAPPATSRTRIDDRDSCPPHLGRCRACAVRQ
jgi:hypothetical protein